MIDPVTAATTVTGLLGITIQVSKALYDQVHTIKNAPKEAKEFLDELRLVENVLIELEVFLKSRAEDTVDFKETSMLIRAVGEFKERMMHLKAEFDVFVQSGRLTRVLACGKWLFSRQEHESKIKTFNRYLHIFQISLSIDGAELLSKSAEDIAADINGIKRAVTALAPTVEDGRRQSKQLDDVLRLLSPLSAVQSGTCQLANMMQIWETKWQDHDSRSIIDWLSPLNFWTKQQDFLSMREEGTGKWLLEGPEFQGWLSNVGTSLWCTGMPGAGKTVLASTIVQFLENEFEADNVGIAFAYCSYSERGNQSATNLTSSFLQQLIQKEGEIPTKVRESYHGHLRKGTRPALSEISILLHRQLIRYTRAFIVVDALDESDDSNGTRSSLITELLKLPSNTSLLVMSRHVPMIGLELNPSTHLEVRASDNDIKLFVESQIQKESLLQRHVQTDRGLKGVIVETIVKEAQGMFLLAKLHMKSLARKPNRRAVRSALNSLPKGLDDTYDDALKRVHNQDDDVVRLAKQTLSWVSCAARQLSVCEIKHALSIDLNGTEIDEDAIPEEDVLVSICCGLIAIDRQSNAIRLAHYTTQEYLERRRWSIMPQAHSFIARACLTYLSFNSLAKSPCKTDEEFQELLQDYPLLEYAAKFWGKHAKAEEDSIVVTMALDFLHDDTRRMVTTQVLHIPKFLYRRYSQNFPRQTTALHIAAQFGLEKVLEILLQDTDSEPNARNSFGQTPLALAAMNGEDEAVSILVENQDVNINVPDADGRSPLSLAAENGHLATLRLLMTRDGLDVNSKDRYGLTPLSYAAENGQHLVVEELLSHIRVNANAADSRYGQTPILRAAQRGHAKVVQILLSRPSVDPDLKDTEYGKTPLSWAARNGHEEVARLLLECKGVDPNSRDKGYGQTPLSWAAENGHDGIVRLLLEYDGVDPDIRDSDETGYGQTPLSWAAWKGHDKVVKVLLSLDSVDRNSRDSGSGRTPLSWAAEKGHESVVRLLLSDAATSPDTKDFQSNRSPLSYAAEKGHEGVVRLLLSHGGVDVGSKDLDYHRTALDWARSNGHEGVVQILLGLQP